MKERKKERQDDRKKEKKNERNKQRKFKRESCLCLSKQEAKKKGQKLRPTYTTTCLGHNQYDTANKIN